MSTAHPNLTPLSCLSPALPPRVVTCSEARQWLPLLRPLISPGSACELAANATGGLGGALVAMEGPDGEVQVDMLCMEEGAEEMVGTADLLAGLNLTCRVVVEAGRK